MIGLSFEGDRRLGRGEWPTAISVTQELVCFGNGAGLNGFYSGGVTSTGCLLGIAPNISAQRRPA